ncbi:hypothetical protein KPL71_017357 [Citrus sinensis]|uniref:Uncharacterized protein n=1 Tax=Citrus sinensis TaxID=2711 RepID=A0ACB8JRH8_CITSI|nr:hypothetical protein KPL71_017357 [Citrus sinensis]
MQIVVQILVMVRLWKKPRRAPKASASFNPETVFQLQNFADRFGAHRARKVQPLKVAESLPQICFLSGLGGEEMKMFIEAFPETGLEPAVFAALVPNSADKPLQELIEEVMGHHEMLIHLEAWKLT